MECLKRLAVILQQSGRKGGVKKALFNFMKCFVVISLTITRVHKHNIVFVFVTIECNRLPYLNFNNRSTYCQQDCLLE